MEFGALIHGSRAVDAAEGRAAARHGGESDRGLRRGVAVPAVVGVLEAPARAPPHPRMAAAPGPPGLPNLRSVIRSAFPCFFVEEKLVLEVGVVKDLIALSDHDGCLVSIC